MPKFASFGKLGLIHDPQIIFTNPEKDTLVTRTRNINYTILHTYGHSKFAKLWPFEDKAALKHFRITLNIFQYDD